MTTECDVFAVGIYSSSRDQKRAALSSAAEIKIRFLAENPSMHTEMLVSQRPSRQVIKPCCPSRRIPSFLAVTGNHTKSSADPKSLPQSGGCFRKEIQVSPSDSPACVLL